MPALLTSTIPYCTVLLCTWWEEGGKKPFLVVCKYTCPSKVGTVVGHNNNVFAYLVLSCLCVLWSVEVSVSVLLHCSTVLVKREHFLSEGVPFSFVRPPLLLPFPASTSVIISIFFFFFLPHFPVYSSIRAPPPPPPLVPPRTRSRSILQHSLSLLPSPVCASFLLVLTPY